MGSLRSDKVIYLLMVGLDNAGKTCTAKSIVGETLECVAPTVGFSKVDHKYKVCQILIDQTFNLFRNSSIQFFQGYHVTLYDLGGSKSFRGIWPKYYHEVHGFIFVVDSSDPDRLSECSAVLQGMLDHHQVTGVCYAKCKANVSYFDSLKGPRQADFTVGE